MTDIKEWADQIGTLNNGEGFILANIVNRLRVYAKWEGDASYLAVTRLADLNPMPETWPFFVYVSDNQAIPDAINNDIWLVKPPLVLCVPANGYATELRHMLNSIGYLVHVWCGDNMIFVQHRIRMALN